MMKPLPLACLVLSALLAGCATTEKARESWVGATFDEVVRAWGPSVRSGTLSDGTEVHTWISEGGPVYRSGPSVGFGGFGGSGGRGVGVGVSVPIGGGTVEPPARCERTLSFREARLVEQTWIGDDAVCSTYTRAK